MTFLSYFETKEYLLPHLTLKEGGVGVSDFNVILTLSHKCDNLSMDVTTFI